MVVLVAQLSAGHLREQAPAVTDWIGVDVIEPIAPDEEWRPIEDHEGYEVSSYGRVRSFRNPGGHLGLVKTPKLLKCAVDRYGYFYISLGSHYRTKVHRLVLEAFVQIQPSPDLVCRHLDGNPENNHFKNLCWGTIAENYDDRRRHGTSISGGRNPKVKLTEVQVYEIRASVEVSDKELSVKYQVSLSTIWNARTKRTWTNLK